MNLILLNFSKILVLLNLTVAVVKGVKIIRDKTTSISQGIQFSNYLIFLGYGFIEFESNDIAKFVLESLNEKPIPNSSKTFKLNWATFGGSNMKSYNLGGNKNDPSQQEYSVY